MGKWSAVGTIIALVVGAGVLGIPYVVVRAGFWNGFVQIFLIGSLMIVLNLFVGEIVLRTKGKHQLVELAKHYLGARFEKLMFITFMLGQYGALVAYLVGIKNILITLFGPWGLLATLLTFAALSLLLLMRLHMLADIETGLTIVMLILIGIIALSLFSQVDYMNFSVIGSAPFSAYGVILFSVMGFTIIPEVIRELKKKEELVSVVFNAFLVIMLINALFAYVFVGVYGFDVAEIATNSLSGSLLYIGGFLVMSMLITSFLAIGLVLKDMFVTDLEVKKTKAWLFAIVPAYLFFFVARPDFINVLGIVGSFTAGIVGILVCWMVLRSRKRGNRKPEFVVPGGSALVYVLIGVLSLGVVWQALHLF